MKPEDRAHIEADQRAMDSAAIEKIAQEQQDWPDPEPRSVRHTD